MLFGKGSPLVKIFSLLSFHSLTFSLIKAETSGKSLLLCASREKE